MLIYIYLQNRRKVRSCWSFLSGNVTIEQMEGQIGVCTSCEQTCVADLKESIIIARQKIGEKINLSGKTWKKVSDKTDHSSLPKRQWSVLDPNWKLQGQLPRQPKPESCSSNYVTVSSSTLRRTRLSETACNAYSIAKHFSFSCLEMGTITTFQ